MIIADKEYQKLSANIKNEIVGRYTYSTEEKDANGMLAIYFIEEYRAAFSQIVFRRLFDDNGLLLDH